MEKFADGKLKFDENGRNFLKWMENTEGKGEIANYEQFLLFPLFSERVVLQTQENQALFGKRLSKT